MRCVVVGVDGSPPATVALRWAENEARLHQQPLTAVLAWGAPGDPHTSDEEAREALVEHVTDALGRIAARDVAHLVVDSLPESALLDASADCDLLVVGARGMSGLRRMWLGSVSDACLHRATCSVAIIREDAPPTGIDGERIVVGIDGSEPARAALRWATREAQLRHGQLEVLHAWHLPSVGSHPYIPAEWDPTLYRAAARRTLDVAVDSIDERGLAHPVEPILSEGAAAATLLEAAEGAAVVVLGSRGLGGFGSLLLGSVGDQIAHHAPCPVVVVRGPQPGS